MCNVKSWRHLGTLVAGAIAPVAIVVTAVAVVVVGAASSAGAHGASGADHPATNYETRVIDGPEGFRFGVREGGNTLMIARTADADLVIMGYDGEPYARIDDRGVFTNQNSSATFLNQSQSGDAAIPAGVDNDPKRPRWKQASTSQRWYFHDHRAHWMAASPPAEVQADPSKPFTIFDPWVVPLRVDGDDAALTGTLRWVPAPNPLLTLAPWAVILGVALVAVARWSAKATVTITAAVALAATAIDLARGGSVRDGRWLAALVGLAPVLVAAAAVVFGVVRLWQGRPVEGTAMAAGGGAGLVAVLGVTGIDWWFHSQVPLDVPAAVGRGMIAVFFIHLAVSLVALQVEWLRASPVHSEAVADPQEAGLGHDG